MSLSDQPEGSGVTVNVALVAFWPPTLTANVPEDAPVGMITAIDVAFQDVTTAFGPPFSETVLLPWVVPKLVPERITTDPTGPDVGEIELIVGACA